LESGKLPRSIKPEGRKTANHPLVNIGCHPATADLLRITLDHRFFGDDLAAFMGLPKNRR
jgi:hypothetical protein